MQKFLLLGVVAVAIAGMVTALAGNEISLGVQDMGIGENKVTSPVDNGSLNLQVNAIQHDLDNIPGNGNEFFKNKITECSFHSPQDLEAGSTLICKLLGPTQEDADAGEVIVEGKITLTEPLPGSTTVMIPMEQFAFDNSNRVDFIKRVKIIITGPGAP